MLLETIAGLRSGGQRQHKKIDGLDVTHTPPESRGMGFAYQDSLLYPFLTVRDNICLPPRARGLKQDH
jgi:ABC-type sugar transport system ATPase subunit